MANLMSDQGNSGSSFQTSQWNQQQQQQELARIQRACNSLANVAHLASQVFAESIQRRDQGETQCAIIEQAIAQCDQVFNQAIQQAQQLQQATGSPQTSVQQSMVDQLAHLRNENQTLQRASQGLQSPLQQQSSYRGAATR